MSDAPLKLMVVDDQEITRLGLVSGLQKQNPALQIVAESVDGNDAINKARQHKPDLILMDIFMPGTDGITATHVIKSEMPDVKIILFTGNEQDERTIAHAFSAGADAYCKKDIRMERLVQIIDMVSEGAIWMDPAIAKTVMAYLTRQTPPISPTTKPGTSEPDEIPDLELTGREVEVLDLIIAGKSNKEIARLLTLSINTVKTHVRNVIQKMAVDDRTQAAVKGLQSGMRRVSS